ncbi:MAG TPA: ATPase, T2SS/T4P/T4SS family, partial [Candidatus Hydrogenedentes bacterium]|nr:ATPase, T2SS/T4P/T4SS family [Candidatus Hydrogenedentota bacterium]
MREHIREVGYPEELFFETHDCTILLSGTDFDNRVDSLRITLKPKDGFTAEQVSASLTKANIPNQVLQKNGSLVVNLPPFEWRQLARLAPADKIIDDSAVQSLRSRSWQVSVKKYRRTNININVLIEIMRERDASDLHLRAGSPPYIRVDNDLMPLEGHSVLSADDMQDMVFQLGGPKEVELLEAERESSFNFHATGIGYLRVSGYFKHGAMALAVRLIPEAPVPFEQLNIPMVVRNIAHSHRGLFLVCGVTGSGKSTTLASMLDYINEQRHCHIISVEDPVEFVYKDKKSIISQRQVGRDTFSFANALRGALREDPDVILVGEMRDMETIRAAISAAETGHLVFSTLHTMTAVDTVNRVISYFPQAER